MKSNIKVLIVVGLLLINSSLHATHIVGGELTYSCLGNDQYLISLTVFRDCYNGVPPFDNPASIGVFDANNNYLFQLLVPFQGDDTLDLILNDPCLVAPPNVCVHRTTYSATTSLPFLSGGYQLAYQRCCRNHTINNIISPDSTGATYYAYVSEAALLGCNNSATFVNWPPPLICGNIHIIFDHSAIDIDGDSLVYELCAPFDGATPSNPRPQPPNAPPYDSVNWLVPFGTENMMTNLIQNNDPLHIDPNTGLLTGMPNILGQFVIGVCVREYRNGILISTTKRDFQYNVGLCGLVTQSSFVAPIPLCADDLTVDFINTSPNLSQNFAWDFGVQGINTDVSNLSSPTYAYSDTGAYLVTLIASPGSVCVDTFTQIVRVYRNTLEVDFGFASTGCDGGLTVQLQDLSVDSAAALTFWLWQVFPTNQSSALQNPTFTFTQDGQYIVGLRVGTEHGCVELHVDTLTVNTPTFALQDSLIGCAGGQLELNPNGNPDYEYSWSPAQGLSDPNSPNPTAAPLVFTLYAVEVQAFNGVDSCTFIDSIAAIVTPGVNLSASADTAYCYQAGGSFTLSAQSTDTVQFQWSLDPNFIQGVSNGASLAIAPSELTTYYVRAFDALGCTTYDTVQIDVQQADISTFSTIQGCIGDSIRLEALNLFPATPLSYNWQPAALVLGNNQQATVLAVLQSDTVFTVEAISPLGCSDSATVFVSVQSNSTFVTASVEPDSIYAGQSTQLQAFSENGNTVLWQPAATLNDPQSLSPIANPTVNTTYTVTTSNALGCEATDSVTVFLKNLICDVPYIFVPSAFSPNDDGVNDLLFVRSNVTTAVYLAIYDRWGELVFETQDLNLGWDGTFGGIALPPDVYGYYLKATCFDQQTFFGKGNISLLR